MKDFGRRIKRAYALSRNARGPIREFFAWGNGLITKFFALLGLVSLILSFADQETASIFQVISYDTVVFIFRLLVLLLVLWVLGYATDFAHAFGETNKVDRSNSFYLAQAFGSTKRLSNLIASNDYSAGGAVEIFSHPDNDYNIGDNGWSTTEFTFSDPTKKVVAESIFQNRANFSPNDKRFVKISLLEMPLVLSDSFTPLKLNVGLTTWEHANNTQDGLKVQSGEIDTHEDIVREKLRHSRIAKFIEQGVTACFPNILCLHAVCLTKDNEFIALDRAKGIHYYSGKLTISFEEQMALRDFQSQENSAAEEWFRRALCEEIFPLRRYSSEPKAVWPLISHHVRSMRIWAGILEETLPNFAVLGVIQLNLTASELAAVQTKLLNDPKEKNRFDHEGNHFVISKDQVEGLLKEGSAAARWLRFPEKPDIIVKRDELHPTALYRAVSVFSRLG